MASKSHQEADPNAIIANEGGFIFKPKAFNIVWGSDTRYWRIPRSPIPEYDEQEAAELIQVSWLEVTGSVKLEPSTRYEISFKLSFRRDSFGWSGAPIFLMAKVGKKGKYKWKRLKELDNLPKDPIMVPTDDSFTIEPIQDIPDKRLYFGLYEVWSGKWKGGLKVHEAIVKKLG
ncbi:hypothetical protein Godav_004537 [Gossypium davidsonii]|uniref:Protein PHLOEM PROTEIN 2-LIKE A9-like n=3 Tax=Gossypium TaxID=3633 RepID=A0A7J9JZG4_9ROSI|nr:hypothetical protein [Gossypium davidsonii]MBA0662603.1 hypothetical protein [Gossypium klotzschianum]MBA0839581.1 hypothetical protein [Gossypium armourianum]